MGFLWGRNGHAAVVIAQILVCSAGIVSTFAAFNALSGHGACTLVWVFLASALITLISSIQTFSRIGWLTWFSTMTFIAAVVIFTVALSWICGLIGLPQHRRLVTATWALLLE